MMFQMVHVGFIRKNYTIWICIHKHQLYKTVGKILRLNPPSQIISVWSLLSFKSANALWMVLFFMTHFYQQMDEDYFKAPIIWWGHLRVLVCLILDPQRGRLFTASKICLTSTRPCTRRWDLSEPGSKFDGLLAGVMCFLPYRCCFLPQEAFTHCVSNDQLLQTVSLRNRK